MRISKQEFNVIHQIMANNINSLTSWSFVLFVENGMYDNQMKREQPIS